MKRSNTLARHRRLVLIGVVAAVMATPSPSASALTVFDPANFSANSLQAYRALVQITHAVTQIRNQLLMLKSLKLNTVYEVRAAMDALHELSQEVEAVVSFPEDFSRLTADQMAALQAKWIRDRRAVSLHAMRVQQALVDAMPATSSRLQTVGNAARLAIGQKSAVQANAQMLGQLGSQLQSLEATTVASHRLAAVREAERAAWHEYYRQRRIEIHRDDNRTFARVRVADPFPRSR